MVRNYINKTDRGTNILRQYEEAVRNIDENKISLIKSAHPSGVNCVTLQRIFKMYQSKETRKTAGCRRVRDILNIE